MTELEQKIQALIDKHGDYGLHGKPDRRPSLAKEIAGLVMPEESDCNNLPEVANKRFGSDFNEFYIEALEATILDLTGKRIEDKEKLENQITKRKIEEYRKFLIEWNGSIPDRQKLELQNIENWLDQGGE